MTQNEIGLLLKKYRLGNCTQEEKTLLEDWFTKEFLESDFKWNTTQKEIFKTDTLSQINAEIRKEENERTTLRTRQLRLKLSAAAACIIVIIGLYIINNKQNSTTIHWAQLPQSRRYLNEIQPGKTGATFTFDNKEIRKLYHADTNVQNIISETINTKSITRNEINNSNTKSHFCKIETHKGQQYKIQLTDGSKIWLNAASSISFKIPFDEDTREIHLSGEAYFEVTHNPHKPFIVISRKDSIMVLGTHFNINAYSDEPQYCAALLQGSIQYKQGYFTEKQPITLKPNEVISRTNKAVATTTYEDTDNLVAWKEGYFSFINADIFSVMRQLARWYNIDIHFTNRNYKQTFFGNLRKDAPLTSTLSILEKTGIKFLIRNNKVTVL